MAIKLIKFCDAHLEATEDEVIGETIPPVTMPNGKRKVIDLCEPCKKEVPYQLLIDLLEEFGRDADHEKQRMSRAVPQKVEIPQDQKSQCRFCDRNDFKVQGRKMHERRSHPVELAELEAKEALEAKGDIVVPDEVPANYCRVCETQLSTAQAFEGHLRSQRHAKRLQEVMA